MSNFRYYLGIDFGLKKVGIAIAIVRFADPYKVIRYKNLGELIEKIKRICEEENILKAIVGVSEGQMAQKTEEFIGELKRNIDIPVEKFDETLSTHDAQRLSIEAGVRRSKRKETEDAMAAAVMLQNYLDLRG